jgi:hypothetical protein
LGEKKRLQFIWSSDLIHHEWRDTTKVSELSEQDSIFELVIKFICILQ